MIDEKLDFDVIVMATGFVAVSAVRMLVDICVKQVIGRLPNLSKRKKRSNYMWILPEFRWSHRIPWHVSSWFSKLLYGLWQVSHELFVSYIVLSQTLAGPNISTGHASVIYSHEVQVMVAVLSWDQLALITLYRPITYYSS